LGLAGRWVATEGRPALIGLVVTATAVVVFQNWSILGIYILVVLAWLAVQARKRVVVEEFVDHTGESSVNGEEAGKSGKRKDDLRLRGIATLLVVELARLQGLYRVVDERRAIGTAVGEGRPLDATVKVEALSEILQSAVSAESKVSLGPITIPIGTLMAILGRLVQGPQLTGALHDDGGALILTVQLTGGSGLRHSWRIEGQSPEQTGKDRSVLVNEMISQLASRMFTDLTLAKSVNWRATQHFIEALRAFRRCLRVPRNRKLNLKIAERELIEAFSEDDGFGLVFYNLGVVYTELWRMALKEAEAMKSAYDLRASGSLEDKETEAADHLHAAEVAFARAIDQDPGRWEAYYALGLTRFERGRRRSVVEQCERVLALKPSLANRAKAWDLKGLAEFRREENRLVVEAAESGRKAVWLSLRALQRAELLRSSARGSEIDPVPALKDQAARCLLNLAVVLAEIPVEQERVDLRGPPGWRARAPLRRAGALFALALSLTNRDAVLRFEFGKILASWGCLRDAEREFTAATRIDPDHALYWAELAGVQVSRRDDGNAGHSCRRALEMTNLSSVTDEDRNVRRSLVAIYRKLNNEEESRRVADMDEFAEKIGVYEWGKPVTPAQVRKLKEWLAENEGEEGREWEAGHLARLLGVAKLNSGAWKEAKEYFQRAIESFEPEYPEEIRRYGIRARLAMALVKADGAKALAEAERALAVDPLRQLERKTLGKMLFGLNDYEHARAAWESALLWSPNDPELHWSISKCLRKLANEETRAEQRRKKLEEAAAYLEQALELYGGDIFDNRLRAHYWLGRLYGDLRDFQNVIGHLRIVQTNPELEVMADLLIGEAFLRGKAYGQAEEHFARVIGKGEKRLRRKQDVRVGAEVENEVPLALVVAWAYWGRAFCDAERDANLDRALSDVEVAERLVERLSRRLAANGDSEVDLAPILQNCSDCRGWITLKQDRVDDAIVLLTDAVRRGADSETYVHLALAYEMKAAKSDDAARPPLVARVRSCCAHAVDTDVTGESGPRVEEILARL
jgi:tetratricopeptide (TPR) repeat protein